MAADARGDRARGSLAEEYSANMAYGEVPLDEYVVPPFGRDIEGVRKVFALGQ